MILTQDMLQRCCVTEKGKQAVVKYLDALNKYCPEYGINSHERMSMFLAQFLHETSEFTVLTENLNYSAKGLAATWKRFRNADGSPTAKAIRIARKPVEIANTVYANRYGNGDYASGDGWRYRGRGGKQTTFKANYQTLQDRTGLQCVADPDLLLTVDGAIISACDFWKRNNCNRFADRMDCDACSRKINGGNIGLKERRTIYERLRPIFGF